MAVVSENYNEWDVITLEANADLSAKQFHFVDLSSDAQIQACNATADIPIGVIVNDPDAAGDPADIVMIASGRIVKLTVDGNASAIAVADKLDTSALGKGVKSTAGHFYATALEASTGKTDVIPVLLGGGNSTKV
jgi:hypothetical protein